MRIIQSSVTEPVTLDEVKDAMGYATGSRTDDDLIHRTISEMRSLLEEHTGLFLANRHLTVYPTETKVRLPFRPVTGIDSVTCIVEGREVDVEVVYLWNAEEDPTITYLLPEGGSDVRIELDAGLEDTPLTIKGAIIDLCKAKLERAPIEPVMQEIQRRCYMYFREEI